MLQVTANSLYTAHYTGTVTAGKRDFNNVSGFVRYKKTNGPMSSYYLSLSRNERTPDATELFHAKTSMAMGAKYRLRHIGNPNLDSEKHTTIELGFENMLFNSHLNDYIYINELIINPNRVNCNDLLINFCAFLSSAYANFLLTKNIVINPGINNKR